MKRDNLDVLWSHIIKLRSGGYCQYDGKYFGVKSQGLHAAHWFGRGRKNLRYDLSNGCALCYFHHMYLDHHPLEKTEYFIGLYGQKEFERLNILNRNPSKIDREELKTQLENKLKELEMG